MLAAKHRWHIGYWNERIFIWHLKRHTGVALVVVTAEVIIVACHIIHITLIARLKLILYTLFCVVAFNKRM